MKKVLSIFIVLSIIFTLGTTVYADSQKCSCNMTPVVYVPGFGEPIYKNPNSENKTTVFPPDENAIKEAVPDILKAVFLGLLTGNFEAFGTYGMKAAETMLLPAACDKEGNPQTDTGVEYEKPVNDTHKNAAFVSEHNSDNGYFKFIYDWRIDPFENAKLLKTYIDEVKALTGHDKVVIAAHSQGNTVVTSYLHLYGNNDVEKLVFLSPAYQGLSFMGTLFTQQVSIVGKGDAFAEYICGAMGYEDTKSQMISAVLKEINEIGTIDAIFSYLQKVLDSQLDRVFNDCLTDILGTLPGVWAFVPDEYYETAKQTVFKNSNEYSRFIEKIDNYHYNVQNNSDTILRNAKSSGTDIVICAGYNISTIPVAKTKEAQSDLLIDTKYMSFGATCAPYGESLGKSYTQQNISCGHNHISADEIIDASTCLFPEFTWFLKNNGHNSFGSDYCRFIEWSIRYNGQPTVHSDAQYPQFLKLEGDNLVPVDTTEEKDGRSNGEIIFSSLLTLIKESF